MRSKRIKKPECNSNHQARPRPNAYISTCHYLCCSVPSVSEMRRRTRYQSGSGTVNKREERYHNMVYAAQRNHKVLYPPSNAFYILPIQFSKEVFQFPLFTRNNKKFDHRNEKDGKCKGDQCSLQYCDT
jgi:hypothetical protein